MSAGVRGSLFHDSVAATTEALTLDNQGHLILSNPVEALKVKRAER